MEHSNRRNTISIFHKSRLHTLMWAAPKQTTQVTHGLALQHSCLPNMVLQHKHFSTQHGRDGGSLKCGFSLQDDFPLVFGRDRGPNIQQYWHLCCEPRLCKLAKMLEVLFAGNYSEPQQPNVLTEPVWTHKALQKLSKN